MSNADHSSLLVGATLFLALLALVCGHYDDQSEVTDIRSSENIPSDISRLLLKNMRFRDVEDMERPGEAQSSEAHVYSPFDWESDRKPSALGKLHTFLRMARNPNLKRERNRDLMNYLAEVLSGNGERDSGSALRMPSLRFG